MSPNNGILLNGVLRPKILNIPLASCSFINSDFLLPHTTHFYDSIVLSFLVFNTFAFFLHFKQYGNMFYNDLCLVYERFKINLVPSTFFIRLFVRLLF